MKTNMRKRWIILMLAGLMVLPCSGVLTLAQEAGDEKKTAAKDLTPNAKFIKERLESLLLDMSNLANALQEVEPEVAKILRRAVAHAQTQDVGKQMDLVIDALKRGEAEAAKNKQTAVVGHLRKLLDIIEGGVKDKSDTDEKLATLKAAQEKANQLIKDQQKEEKESRAAAHQKEIDKQTAAIIAGLKKMVAEQEKLHGQAGKLAKPTSASKKLNSLRDAAKDLHKRQAALNEAAKNAPLGQLPVLGQMQKKLQAQAAELQKKIAAAAKDAEVKKAMSDAKADAKSLEKTAGLMKSAAGEMQRSSKALSKSSQGQARRPQEQAAEDLKNTEKLLGEALKKMAAQTPAGKMAGEQNKLGTQAEAMGKKIADAAKKAGIDPKSLKGTGSKAASGDMNKAAGHMKQASEKLNSSQGAKAQAQQKKALAELKEQLAKAQQLRDKALAKAKKQLNAEQQKKIAAGMKKLANQMSQNIDGKPMPGQKSASKASQSAQSAAGKMSKSQSGQQADSKGANEDQNKAVEEMKKAAAELQDEIEKLEEQSKKEKLAKIEEELEKVLEKQKIITVRTEATYKKSKKYDRQGIQALAEMAKQEGNLADTIKMLRDMLVKEGTTIVFPEVLGDVKKDLDDVQKLLSERDAGPLTQATQENIETALQELIGAVRKELSKGPGRKKGGGKGGAKGGGGKKPPLIPPIAELRMLRLKQVRINRETVKVDKMIQAKQLNDAQIKQSTGKLADRQQSVTKLAEGVKKKLSQGGR